MDRIEARKRIDAAIATLLDCGWTKHQTELLIDGLYRDDAVDRAEEAARAAVQQVV